jgi:O-antigen ligase
MVGGAIAVALAFAVVPGLTAKADARGSDLRPVWDRLNTNAAALRMLEDRPALGFGWGSFEQGSLPYLRQADRYPLTGYGIPVHNVLLGNAVALGAVGMAVWLTAWCWALMGPLRRFGSRFPELDAWRAGLVALILHWLVVSLFTPVAYPLPIMLLWVWAGIVWGLRQDPGLRLASRHDRSGMTADVSLQPVTAL